jgi:hypothetical protein
VKMITNKDWLYIRELLSRRSGQLDLAIERNQTLLKDAGLTDEQANSVTIHFDKQTKEQKQIQTILGNMLP